MTALVGRLIRYLLFLRPLLDHPNRQKCLFGNSRLFAVGGVFSFPGSVVSKSSSVQKRQQEIGGSLRELGGISRKQVSACRSVCRVSALFVLAGGVFLVCFFSSAASSAAGGSRCIYIYIICYKKS